MREDVKIGYVVGNVAPSESGNEIVGEKAGFVRYTLTSISARNPYNANGITSSEGSQSAFEIEKNSGNLVISRELDREKQSEYVLEVRALDTSASNNPQSSAVTIRVEVVDVNDNSPKWPSDPIVIELPEDTPVSTVVSKYSATDADASLNADLRYSLSKAFPESGAKTFSVDGLTGIITLDSPLDFEELDRYTLVVQATDQSSNATERRSDTVTFVIHVLDANDNVPFFISPTSEHLIFRDVTHPGALLSKFIAVDKDSGESGRVTYSISGGNEDGRFSLGFETGFLTLARPFAGSENESYVVNVTASDNGSPSLKETFSLRITVRGSSEIPPKFVKSLYAVDLPENVPPETVIATVEAKVPNGKCGKVAARSPNDRDD